MTQEQLQKAKELEQEIERIEFIKDGINNAFSIDADDHRYDCFKEEIDEFLKQIHSKFLSLRFDLYKQIEVL